MRAPSSTPSSSAWTSIARWRPCFGKRRTFRGATKSCLRRDRLLHLVSRKALRLQSTFGLCLSQFPRSNMSRRIAAKITGVAGYVPPRVLTNADLEKMVDTTNEWIMERVGIRERHLADKGVAASDLAVQAVKKLQATHPFDLQEVDLIVVGTVTPAMMYPSTACLVQHKLGIKRTWGFDVSAGCSGFVYALNTGAEFIEAGRYKKVLVIGS